MREADLVGTWKLVSWEDRDPTGRVTHPLGAGAVGCLNYAADGYMFVHIMATGRRKLMVDDPFAADVEELGLAAKDHISYCGRWHLEADRLVHDVEVCSHPNWVGGRQVRRAAFEGTRLVLCADGARFQGRRVDARLVWERAV